jgi:hypothetical protein
MDGSVELLSARTHGLHDFSERTRDAAGDKEDETG